MLKSISALAHIARRQTEPQYLHGVMLTDPIRQFNDYGYTMCSTISGINSIIWHEMGYKTKYWDISDHTVPEVCYDGRYHAHGRETLTQRFGESYFQWAIQGSNL